MKVLLVVLVICAFTPAQEKGIPIHGPTGEKLVSDCSSISRYNEQTKQVDSPVSWSLGYCMGYISGMVDSSDILSAVTRNHGVYCVPPEASVTQLVRVVVKYGNDHPEELHLPGFALVANALAKAFPCP